MNPKKKLQLTPETLKDLSTKTGVKTGAWSGACLQPPPPHTMAKSCVFPK